MIPCYNSAGTVASAVASAVAEKPSEIICVDDGSVDGTVDVLRSLSDAHPELVTVRRNQENGGAPRARNTGLSEVKGAYVQFLDADDRLLPGKLDRQVALVERHTADLVVGTALEERATGGTMVREIGGRNIWSDIARHRAGITSANLFRTASVRDVGGWDEGLICSQEYDLMFRMARAGARAVYDQEEGAFIGYHEGSVGKHPRAFLLNMDLRSRLLAYDEEHAVLSDDERQDVLDCLFRWIRARFRGHPEEAEQAFSTLIPPGYIPRSGGNTSRLFVWAYRVVGWRRAEQLRGLISRSELAS